MSTRTPPRSLFRGLVDDAAVFPPGNAPVARAWEEHLRLRREGYADLLGPLLVGTGHAAGLAQVAGEEQDGAPVAVAVVCRPGTPVEELLSAVARLRVVAAVRVVSVETALDPAGSWRRALDLEVPVAVEVGPDPGGMPRALDALAAATGPAGRVLAKLRTQATPQQPVPAPSELAAFLVGADARDLPVKLTGGLHHAVARGTAGGAPPERHGVLNVLVAVARLMDGADEEALVEALRIEDADRLVGALTSEDAAPDEAAVTRLRHRFRSFGCCGVTDPLDELAALGVLTR
ncbi:hypothetical protein [Ornithinimicrobium sp. W1665]|uniref:hypothetical protein n=1 Tax=Ornithinimicrobium sp. W1665 TaxID=3416666 RepID=UPI003CFA767B